MRASELRISTQLIKYIMITVHALNLDVGEENAEKLFEMHNLELTTA